MCWQYTEIKRERETVEFRIETFEIWRWRRTLQILWTGKARIEDLLPSMSTQKSKRGTRLASREANWKFIKH